MPEFNYKDFVIEYEINQEGEQQSLEVIDGESGETITSTFLSSDIEIFGHMAYNHRAGMTLNANIKKKLTVTG